MSFASSDLPPPSLATLLTAVDAVPARVLCTGGVVWNAVGEGRWQLATGGPGPARAGQRSVGARPPALGLVAVDRWMRAHALWPVAFGLPDGAHGERLVLLSAAGALGWRPPLELLAGARAPGLHAMLRRAALRLRPLIDAAEQHALDAAERYARAAATATRVARLLDTAVLDTVGVEPGLFVAVDALVEAALRTLDAADALAESVFGHQLVGAPATLRASLLEARLAHAVPAAAVRRAVRRQAAAGLGPPAARVEALGLAGGTAWVVRVPVSGSSRFRGAPLRDRPSGTRGAAAAAARASAPDAFERAWQLATAAWHALTLVVYAAVDGWQFD